MVSGLHDVIRVGAVFDAGAIKPMWFQYKGKKVSIENIIYKWQEKSGNTSIIKFSVQANEMLYEIGYSTIDMKWLLFAYDENCLTM